MPVSDEILDALIQWESGGNPNRVGKAGEIGLAQIKPSTAAQYGVSAEALYHPEVNRMVARRYLNDLMNHYQGDLAKALAAYNAGPGNVDRGLIPQSTRQYVSGILARAGGGQAFAALPAGRPPQAPEGPVVPWQQRQRRAYELAAPSVPMGLAPAARAIAAPPRMAARGPVPEIPGLPAGIARTAAPSAAPGVPNVERATGLLEERMHLLLITLGIPQRISRLLAGAYASVYKLPFARPRLLQALTRPEGLDGLITADQPKVLQLARLLRTQGMA